MVFSNPGIMLISLKQYYQGGESICRNKYLQTLFTFLGSAEKAGSGVDKILTGWKVLNWKRPYLFEKKRPNKIVLTLSMESLLDNDLKETLQKMFGNKLDALDHNQLMALALAYSEEEISNERLQYALEMHKADISKMLGKLCKLQLLESSGYGRGTKYHVYGVDVSKKGKVATSDRKVATSDQKVATSDQKVATYKKHYSKEELRELIVEYCTEWRTLDDISVYIGRNRKYLRNKVLPQMTNILEKMYENIPNHPRQKYRAKRKEADT